MSTDTDRPASTVYIFFKIDESHNSSLESFLFDICKVSMTCGFQLRLQIATKSEACLCVFFFCYMNMS